MDPGNTPIALDLDVSGAPPDLLDAVFNFWASDEWSNALRIAWLESGWNAFAERDTRRVDAPCGTVIERVGDTAITAEWSIGYFQINACNLRSGWNPAHLFNTLHNVGTAHMLWSDRGWRPWYFSARKLGLL